MFKEEDVSGHSQFGVEEVCLGKTSYPGCKSSFYCCFDLSYVSTRGLLKLAFGNLWRGRSAKWQWLSVFIRID